MISLPVAAECDVPKPTGTLPNGATASREEIVAAIAAMKQYDAAVNAYTGCLDMETNYRIAAAGATATKAQMQAWKASEQQKRNAAVDELQARADELNKEVRAFKARETPK